LFDKYNIYFKEKQMRDILNLLDSVLTITEGVGLANRQPGEQFKNSAGDVIAFQSLEFYPPSGKFPPGEEMSNTISDLKKQGMNIHWTNQAAATSGAFAIATFTGEKGKPYYLGRFYKEINPNRALNNFPHDAIPGGFKFASKVGAKENTGYKPSEVLTQFQDNTPETIMNQIVDKFGKGSDEVVAAATFMQASKFPVSFPKGSINFTAFRDYFCEMLQPVALVMGKPVKGNAQDAATIFFGPGAGYSDATISFNNNVTGGLYDSLLVSPNGKQIKLSSKGKSGANASVVNLLRSIQELQVAPKGKKLLEKHRDVVDVLNVIDKSGHTNAPLELAVKYQMITPQEANEILTLKNVGPNDPIDFKSKGLNTLYQSRTPKDWSKIIPLEHMLSVIAYRVADYVNKHTNFGQAASEILNHSALVQMYTEASETADIISITGFRAVYPSDTVSGVLLDASKAYMSTQGKGNFTFKILKNGAKEADLLDPVANDLADEPTVKSSTVDLDQVTSQRSNVKAGGNEKLGTEKALGRKRQR